MIVMKRPIFHLLFSILLFVCSTAGAQSFSLGAKGGISIPNLTAGSGSRNPVNTGYSSRLGPEAAILAEFKVSRLFSLQPMIEYSSQGGKKDGLQGFATPDAMAALFPPGQAPAYLYADYKSEAKMNYLMIPVLARFGKNIGRSHWRIYIDAGPFVAFLLAAHQVTSGESQFYLDPARTEALPGGQQSFEQTTDIKSQLNSVNVGIEGNIGLNYRYRSGNFFIEGGGNYGFLNIQKSAQDGKNNTGAATVAIGYSYCFGQ